jgi:RimJ/RimL family protein N-acetyltransferase
MAHSYLFIDGVWQDHLRFALLNHDWQTPGNYETKIIKI